MYTDVLDAYRTVPLVVRLELPRFFTFLDCAMSL